ncbi:MAG: HAD family phosphatase [Candidatus Blackburnbacteria bacterium]|nr:HAD family phosphatase [Candidatus Blackburnbacteria bacterium]
MNYSAVIFDLDGTILLNEEVYARAFCQVLAQHGVHLNPKERTCPHALGIGMEENWKIFAERFNLPADLSLSQLVHETQDAYHKRIGEVIVRPGFWQLQEELAEQGTLLALATSNNWWLVEDELEDLGLQKYFNTLVTREEVANPKPAPDIFWKAAEKLFVEPSECVVIEDSLAGVEAAKEAGMVVVAVLGEYTKHEDFGKANLVAEGFGELTSNRLDSLFSSKRACSS